MAVYCMVHINIHKPEEYAKYIALAGPAMQKYGAKVLCRGGRAIQKEGAAFDRNVLLEFPDFAAAERFYHSPEYQKALSFGIADAVSTRSYSIVAGIDDTS